jgi:hypothetical protein
VFLVVRNELPHEYPSKAMTTVGAAAIHLPEIPYSSEFQDYSLTESVYYVDHEIITLIFAYNHTAFVISGVSPSQTVTSSNIQSMPTYSQSNPRPSKVSFVHIGINEHIPAG